MSLQYRTLLLREELEKLNELSLDNTKPFPLSRTLTLIPGDKGYFTLFYAPIEDVYDEAPIPEVQVIIAKAEEGKYECGFTVNDNDAQAFEAPIEYYLRIIKTLTLILTRFIQKYNPDSIRVKGMDKGDVYKPGQKDRIYFSFLQQEGPKLGYRVGKDGEGYAILIKNKE